MVGSITLHKAYQSQLLLVSVHLHENLESREELLTVYFFERWMNTCLCILFYSRFSFERSLEDCRNIYHHMDVLLGKKSLLCFVFWPLTVQQVSIWVHKCDYAATNVISHVVKGDHQARLAVRFNLCLANGTAVFKIWAWLIMEFTAGVKVKDTHEQPLAACLSFVLLHLWPHCKEQKPIKFFSSATFVVYEECWANRSSWTDKLLGIIRTSGMLIFFFF